MGRDSNGAMERDRDGMEMVWRWDRMRWERIGWDRGVGWRGLGGGARQDGMGCRV